MKAPALALLLTLLSASMAGARGVPLPTPDPARGTVAVTLRMKQLIGPAVSAIQVYFVRLEDGADVVEASAIVPSNFTGKRQVYLLNCPPGRYVAVGAALSPRAGFRMEVFLDRSGIAETEVSVEPGEVAFMGEMLVNSAVRIDRADAAQAHFLQLLAPKGSHRGFTARAFLSNTGLYLSQVIHLDRSAATEERFWAVAQKKVFRKHPRWQSVVQKLLAARVP